MDTGLAPAVMISLCRKPAVGLSQVNHYLAVCDFTCHRDIRYAVAVEVRDGHRGRVRSPAAYIPDLTIVHETADAPVESPKVNNAKRTVIKSLDFIWKTSAFSKKRVHNFIIILEAKSIFKI